VSGDAGQVGQAPEVDRRTGLYEIVLWRVKHSARYPEGIRYRLAFIRSGERTPALLYDNHHPKGHHRHLRMRQEPYNFVTAEKLVADFLSDASTLAEETK
jgi:Family of unknown function (DUF6516)